MTMLNPMLSALNPAYFNNAKYEDICCKPIKPFYDGTEADLMVFLLCIDIHCQDEGWAPATYVTIDLTCEFTFVMETGIIGAVQDHLRSPTLHIDKYTIEHDACHAPLLAKCLLASLTNDFTLTLMNRLKNQYRNDSNYMVLVITNPIWHTVHTPAQSKRLC